MAKQIIANFLKQLRKTSGLSANEVVTKLQSYNIDISAKTLYGYESGLSMLNADAFVALCRIYKCDNPMDIFGTPSIKSNEIDLIEKYRTLDPFGQETVNYILNSEAARSADLLRKDTRISDLEAELANVPPDPAALLNAAHERTDIPVTEEMKQADDDIMNDENF